MDDTSNRRFAVVTGASSGIGYELARQFAQHGFDLMIASNSTRIEDAPESLSSETGVQVEAVQADLATFDGVEDLYRSIANAERPVHAAAINAGVGVSGDFATGTDLTDELNLIGLNVVSPVHLTKRLIKDMLAQGKAESSTHPRLRDRCQLHSWRFTELLRHSSPRSHKRFAMS